MNVDDKKFHEHLYKELNLKVDNLRKENEESHKVVNNRIDKVADEVKSFIEEFIELKTTVKHFFMAKESKQISRNNKLTIGIAVAAVIWGIVSHFGLI